MDSVLLLVRGNGGDVQKMFEWDKNFRPRIATEDFERILSIKFAQINDRLVKGQHGIYVWFY